LKDTLRDGHRKQGKTPTHIENEKKNKMQKQSQCDLFVNKGKCPNSKYEKSL